MRATTVVGAFAMVMLATGVAAAQDAGSPAALTVRVHVLNRAKVEARDWKFAESVVTTIYRKAGVKMVWDDDGIETPAADRLVDLTILVVSGHASKAAAGSFDLAPEVLGFVPSGATNRGRLVYILEDRVRALSPPSRHVYSALLGRVLAHEVGHVLLPFNSHSLTGIMRERMDVTSRQPEFFTDAQAAVIRARLISGGAR